VSEDPFYGEEKHHKITQKKIPFTPMLLWVGVILMVTILLLGIYKLSNNNNHSSSIGTSSQDVDSSNATDGKGVVLSSLKQIGDVDSIHRQSNLNTIIPLRPTLDVVTYTVAVGDSVFEIAKNFNIKPETVLWANYNQLKDNPDMVTPGMVLKIPPVDGVFYQLAEGDTIDKVAAKFDVTPQSVIEYAGNQFELTNPVKKPGDWVMFPGGHREFQQWLIPVIPRGKAGVLKSVYGSGACEGNYEGAYGTGSFVWPAGNHVLSGNDYWSGHLGIDIGAGDGAAIYAADSGVIVFAGWATGGYGNMVMIDHGNGYQTLYAHMSKVAVSCGRSVSQGQTIGYAGSTGNSTGAHLHFEVRYQGGFINPWYVLPAP
jgi:LysM repeat protein